MSGDAEQGTKATSVTTEYLLQLCREHPDLEVEYNDSTRRAGNCEELTDRFVMLYLDGREAVPINDLIPFIESSHNYWGEVVATVEVALVRHGILSDEQFETEVTQAPHNRREVDLSDHLFIAIPELGWTCTQQVQEGSGDPTTCGEEARIAVLTHESGSAQYQPRCDTIHTPDECVFVTEVPIALFPPTP